MQSPLLRCCLLFAVIAVFRCTALDCTTERGTLPDTVVLPPSENESPSSDAIVAALAQGGFAGAVTMRAIDSAATCCTVCANSASAELKCIAAVYGAGAQACYVLLAQQSSGDSLAPLGKTIPGEAAKNWTYLVPDYRTDPFADRHFLLHPSSILAGITILFLAVGFASVINARRAHLRSAADLRTLDDGRSAREHLLRGSHVTPGSTSVQVIPNYTDGNPASHGRDGVEMSAIPRTASYGHPLFDEHDGADYTNQFRMLKTLGRGQFGTVYLVQHRESAGPNGTGVFAKPAAMKVVTCATADDVSATFSEYLHLKRLSHHPHIVELLDFTLASEDHPPSVSDLGGSPGGSSSRRASKKRTSKRTSTAWSTLPSQVGKKLGIATSSLVIGGDQVSVPQRPDGEQRLANPANSSFIYACILMRYYEEGTLEAAIAAEPEYFRRPATVLSIVTQVARGVAACHALGIAHNDLKPSNILLCDGRTRAVVSDFGLARTLRGVGADKASNVQQGTLAYLPPEAIVHGGNGDGTDTEQDAFAADTWALACVALRLATVGRALGGREHQPLFYWRTESDFEATFTHVLETVCELPHAAVALLLRMASRAPADRPSMAECEALLSVAAPPRRATVFFATDSNTATPPREE